MAHAQYVGGTWLSTSVSSTNLDEEIETVVANRRYILSPSDRLLVRNYRFRHSFDCFLYDLHF